MCACQERFVGQARMSMVDGFPYKEEVGGSSPSVPTIILFDRLGLPFGIESCRRFKSVVFLTIRV